MNKINQKLNVSYKYYLFFKNLTLTPPSEDKQHIKKIPFSTLTRFRNAVKQLSISSELENTRGEKRKIFYCFDSSDVAHLIFNFEFAKKQFHFEDLLTNITDFNLNSLDRAYLNKLLLSSEIQQYSFMTREHFSELLEQIHYFYVYKQKQLEDDIKSQKDTAQPKKRRTKETFTHKEIDHTQIELIEESVKILENTNEKSEAKKHVAEKLKRFLSDILPSLSQSVFTKVIQHKSTVSIINKVISNDTNLIIPANNINEPKIQEKLGQLNQKDAAQTLKAKELFAEIDSNYLADENMYANNEELQFLVNKLESIRSHSDNKVSSYRDALTILKIFKLNQRCQEEKLDFRFQLVTRTPAIHSLLCYLPAEDRYNQPKHPFFLPEVFPSSKLKFNKILEKVDPLFSMLNQQYTESGENDADINNDELDYLHQTCNELSKEFINCFSSHTISQNEQILVNQFDNKRSAKGLVRIFKAISNAIEKGTFQSYFWSISDDLRNDTNNYILKHIPKELTVICEFNPSHANQNFPAAFRLRTGKMRTPFFLYSTIDNHINEKKYLLGVHNLKESGEKLTTQGNLEVWKINVSNFIANLNQIKPDRNSEFSQALKNDIELLKATFISFSGNFELGESIISSRIRSYNTFRNEHNKPKIPFSSFSHKLWKAAFDSDYEALTVRELYILRQTLERSNAFDISLLNRRNDFAYFYKRAERDLYYASRIDRYIRMPETKKSHKGDIWLTGPLEDPRIMTASQAGFIDLMINAWLATELSEEQKEFLSSIKIAKIRFSSDLWTISRVVNVCEIQHAYYKQLIEENNTGCGAFLEYMSVRCIQLNLILFCIGMASNKVTPVTSLWENNKLTEKEHLNFINIKDWSEILNHYNAKTSHHMSKDIPLTFTSAPLITEVVNFVLGKSHSKQEINETLGRIENLKNDIGFSRSFYSQLLDKLQKKFKQKLEETKLNHV